ncbi:MAG: potassium channel protein [Cyclobacteriaceae bacterium]|nr:potassium channel protein [Cyclobacteriaceae bacterium]
MKGPNLRRVVATIVIVFLVYGVLLSILLDLEKGHPNSKINSVQDALWYLVETLTTVGYGDALPQTYWGKMIGFVFLFSSFGVYGFIIGQIANFMTTLKEQKELGLSGTKFEGHVVIIGWNEFGQSVVSTLVAAGRQVAVVTKDRSSISFIHEYYPDGEVFTLYSDYNNFEMLEKVNLKSSSIVFVNLNDDTEKLVYIINIRKYHPNLNYVVTLENGNLKGTFSNAGCTYTISKNEISSKLLASYIYEPDVAILSEELIAYAHEGHEYDMKEFLIRGTNPLVGMAYEKAFFDLKKQSNVILFGLVRHDNGKRKLYKNPESDLTIKEGDYLIMLMDRQGLERLRKIFLIEEGV